MNQQRAEQTDAYASDQAEFIDPVCSYSGSIVNKNSVRTVKPGILRKENQIWKLETKAEIEFV